MMETCMEKPESLSAPPSRSRSEANAPQLMIVADDLTGACDSAVAFAQRGLSTRVVLSEKAQTAGVDVLVRNTNSRNIDALLAQKRLLAAVEDVAPKTVLFKKIDSVIRGNTYVEILSVIELTTHELVILAPAYPELGRRSMDGVVMATDVTGETQIPVLSELRARGLRVGHVADVRQLKQCLDEGEHVLYCDAASQGDLVTLVDAVGRLQRRVLWIGSGGLAHALGPQMRAPTSQPASMPLRRGVVLLFVGSDHAVTRAQVDHLRAADDVKEHDVYHGSCPPVSEGETLVVRITRDDATEDEVRGALPLVSQEAIGCLVMTGGDTAMLVCRALGIEALALSHEFAPGLPMGFAVGGVYDGVPVILKSGGFGALDVLSRIASEFSLQKEGVL